MADAIDHEHMAHALRLAANGLLRHGAEPDGRLRARGRRACRRHGLDGAGRRPARRGRRA